MNAKPSCRIAGTRAIALMLCLAWLPLQTAAAERVSLSLRNTDITEVMEMLSRQERINILLGEGVRGNVSLNLYDVKLETALSAIANAAGYVVEKRDGQYFVLKPENAGKYAQGLTELRTYKVQYSDVTKVEQIVTNHLSMFGKTRVLADRGLLIVEDTPQFQRRVQQLLRALDKEPRQILIEAKILQIQLDDNDSLGFDWTKFFEPDDGTGTFGVKGFNGTGTAGMFLSMQTDNIQLALNALRSDQRVQTLSTPRLLALENQEASVIIGSRLGYKVSTTINLVIQESIEFLESGIILRVTPTIDSENRVMLDIHPEVSDGSLPGGIPQQTTTEVTTQVLVNDGQTIFIGGLINRKSTESGNRVSGISRVPLLGRLFRSESAVMNNTETVVLITPYIVNPDNPTWSEQPKAQVEAADIELDKRANELDDALDYWFPPRTEAGRNRPLGGPKLVNPRYQRVDDTQGNWQSGNDVSW